MRGAALGTVGGRAVSAVMSVWFFFLQRDRPYRIGSTDLCLHGSTVRALMGIGAPSFLAGFGSTLLAVLVNNTLSRAGGVTALAAYAVCARIQTFVMMPPLGISQGLQPIVGYNAGRGVHDRVLRAWTLSLRATIIYGTLTAATVILFAEPLVELFIANGIAAAAARNALRIIVAGVAVAGVAPLVSAYCQALGRATPSYLISIGTLLAVKAPVVFALGHAGTTGVWAALAIGEIGSAMAALVIMRGRQPRTTTT